MVYAINLASRNQRMGAAMWILRGWLAFFPGRGQSRVAGHGAGEQSTLDGKAT